MTSISLPVILRSIILAPFWAGAPLGVLLMVVFMSMAGWFGASEELRSRASHVGMGIGAGVVGCFAYLQLFRGLLGLIRDDAKGGQAKRPLLWFFGIWMVGIVLLLILSSVNPRS